MIWFLSLVVMAAAISAVTLVTVLRRRFAVVTVDGPSMLPALSPGDRVLVRRIGLDQVRSGDVVVFEKPGDSGWPLPPTGRVSGRQWLIKRAVAVPSEPLPVIFRSRWPNLSDDVVPAGNLVVIGDNVAGSYDSRSIGYIPGDRLLGVMARRITPAQPGHPG
jgi:signal peptidase I